ncbi:MAG: 23S rRNA (uracil(1939)-C(5))-methyltransferase RlmD [Patescibacteria group bacterium]|nr:23S rRNA (uracil(1939)-C(5))-methyltransferase RlmD [Patescibacteria group bacterium]
MKFGHKINLKIESYDEKGRGVGEIEIVPGEIRPIVVPLSAKGDELEATFVKRDYGVKICKLDKIVKAGPDRVDAVCQHAGTCGGCLWQHLKYEAQLTEKERGIRELFASLGLESALKSIIPADETLGYRNRMDYCIGWNGEIGLKEYGSWNKYVDVRECLLLRGPSGPADNAENNDVGRTLQIVREFMSEFDLQPWDAKFHTGDMRYVVIRDGQNTKQRMTILVVKDASRINDRARKYLIDKLESHCTSLLIGELTVPTDISFAERFETLIGEPWLEENVNDITYRIHPNSFFQTNSAMAAKLQTVVLNELFDIQRSGHSAQRTFDIRVLLDLYCGLGFFGIAAAKSDKDLKVWGYELDEEAIKLASQNAELNKVVERCNFFSGKAEDLSWKDVQADAVIIDPPRSGLHPKVIKTLLNDTERTLPSTIIYVSCNYHRLKDELPAFLQNYEVTSIQPLDLFPQTPHVEVVVTLRLKTNP